MGGSESVRTSRIVAGLAVLAALFSAVTAQSAVTADQAQQLRGRLTPTGAERAGNAEGTIPAWSGGYISSAPGYIQGASRPDPFAADKPLFAITAANFKNYGDRLPEGAKALFGKFPDYRMDVYPAHRSAAAPQWIYDNVFANATRAHAASAGIAYGVAGAAGGIPFPLPENGFEAMWNHLLAYWGPARELHVSTYVVSPNGTLELTSAYREIADFPYYYPGATPGSLGGYYFKTLHFEDGPAPKAGQGYLAWQPIDTKRYQFNAWRILPGEHRVRKGPSLSYDTPDPDASGYENLDEYYVFFGGLDRYIFRLLGKREMYIPYNNNRFYTRPVKEIAGAKHANPDDLRYEFHRVWVVEGTLAPGSHHVAPRRRLYLDEDTWFAVYGDSWDESGKLWKFAHGTMYLLPDVPAVILGSQFVYDLLLGGYVFGFAMNGEPAQYRVTQPHSETVFRPQSLAAHAVR